METGRRLDHVIMTPHLETCLERVAFHEHINLTCIDIHFIRGSVFLYVFTSVQFTTTRNTTGIECAQCDIYVTVKVREND